jgi:hypothetical protein
VIELVLLGEFYVWNVCGAIIVLQVALNFLEFMRHGAASLDEYELREMSISDAVECENVSELAPFASPSELEPENEAKQK